MEANKLILIFDEHPVRRYWDENVPNSVTIKNHTPTGTLDARLNLIETSIKNDPKLNWQNFRRDGEIKESNFKGLSAAEGSFIVDENILGAKEKTVRKIKRIVIYTNNDLYNIVFASTNINTFESEAKEFDEFMNNLTIK